MTTVTIPSLERRFLASVREEMEAKPIQEWPEQSFGLSLDVVRKLREHGAQMHRALQDELAEGVEARSFARRFGPLLDAVEDLVAEVRELRKRLSSAHDPASQRLAAELHSLEQEDQAFCNLLAEALNKASELPRPVDWERIRTAEEAHARGETKPFSRR